MLDKSSHNFALGPYSYLCVRKFFAYVRQFGIHVSLRTQTICRAQILAFLPPAYAKSVFLFFFAYAGGIIGLFHVEGKINATGGMLYIV